LDLAWWVSLAERRSLQADWPQRVENGRLGFLGRREETNPASFSARELAAEASSG
jgi:hypothetical protein